MPERLVSEPFAIDLRRFALLTFSNLVKRRLWWFYLGYGTLVALILVKIVQLPVLTALAYVLPALVVGIFLSFTGYVKRLRESDNKALFARQTMSVVGDSLVIKATDGTETQVRLDGFVRMQKLVELNLYFLGRNEVICIPDGIFKDKQMESRFHEAIQRGMTEPGRMNLPKV